MKLIDFDAEFSLALGHWIENNRGKFKTADEMEDAAPDFYAQWLQTPAKFLRGETPEGYFAHYGDARELIGLLHAYIKAGVPLPDPLLGRLRALGDEAALYELAADSSASTEARMHAVEILRELESVLPMVDYIRWQVDRNIDEELLDGALESLCAMGDKALGPARIAFAAANDEGKEALLDVLSRFKADDDVLNFAIKRFTDGGLYPLAGGPQHRRGAVGRRAGKPVRDGR